MDIDDIVLDFGKFNNEIWKKNRQPIICTFELNPNCNLHCIHCYLGTHRQQDNMLSLDEIKYILDELARVGVLQLALTGGECTLRKDLPEIYMYAKQKGFLVTIFTNAVCISDEMFKIFEEFPPFYIDISLYGASEETYETITGKRVFRKVLDNIEKLYEKKISFGLKTPVIIQNKNDFKGMKEIYDRFQLPFRTGYVISATIDNEEYPTEFMIPASEMIQMEAQDNVMSEIGFNDADIENPWGERFKKGEFVPVFICSPGVNDVCVDFQGNIFPCPGYRHIGKNIFKNSFEEIWDGFRYIKQIPATSNNKCKDCQSRYFCRVCPAEQKEKTGDYETVSEIVCNFAHAKKMYYKDKKPLHEVVDYLIKVERRSEDEL